MTDTVNPVPVRILRNVWTMQTKGKSEFEPSVLSGRVPISVSVT